MAASGGDAGTSKVSKSMANEQILAGFNKLLKEQKMMFSKIAELEIEKKEHDLVIETLKKVDYERKCFRLVGGVLVERKVKDVLPALIHNCEQISKITDGLQKKMDKSLKELKEYKENHNIQVKGDGDKIIPSEVITAPSVTPVLVEKNN